MAQMLQTILDEAIKAHASDIHLKVGSPPVFRVHGELTPSALPPLSPDDLLDFVHRHVPARQRREFEEAMEADFSLLDDHRNRFRVNLFMAQGVPAFVFRRVLPRPPTLQSVNLPPVLSSLLKTPRGLLIVAGATGGGKSTTLAALIEELNQTQSLRIVTIEDPVEYEFVDNRCVISQREIGIDTLGFQAALKRVMRQDPDVIMIGEIRDPLSVETALHAAETGHLVLTTLHASSTAGAVNRLLDMFPPESRDALRLNLATNLLAILCQQLAPAIRGGVLPVVEILINTPTVRSLLEKNKLEVLPAAVETGSEDGMQTFNQALYQLIKKGQITEETGMSLSPNPQQLRMNLKGIFLDEGRRILPT
jgi:twitching motility protein PilT